MQQGVRTIVLPKIHSSKDLDHVSESLETVLTTRHLDFGGKAINLVASIESARGVWFLDDIAKWKPKPHMNVKLSTLLVRSSFVLMDNRRHCSSVGVVRRRRLFV